MYSHTLSLKTHYETSNFYEIVQYAGIFNGILGSQPQFLSLLLANSSFSGYNFYYVSEYVTTINPGVSAFVFCDNTLSNTFDVLIDSQNMNLRDVYGSLVFDFSGSNEHEFTSINDSITASFGSYNYTITYVASAQHVLKLIPLWLLYFYNK